MLSSMCVWGGVWWCPILDVIFVSYFKAVFRKTPVFLGQSPQKEPEVLKSSCFDGACSYSNLFRPNKCVGFVQITSAPLIAIPALEFCVTVTASSQLSSYCLAFKEVYTIFFTPSWQGMGRLQCTDLGHELICCGFR